MDALAFEHHLTSPQGEGHRPAGSHAATVGGYACCDEVTFSVSVPGDKVSGAGFEARGCGSTTAAASAAVTLVRGAGVLEAARVGPREIAAELGGLSPAKLHAAELAADALARALGAAVRADGSLLGTGTGTGTGTGPDSDTGTGTGADADTGPGAGTRTGSGTGAGPTGPTLVAMSGGVDSAVAAHLCAQRGPAIAVTLELWSDSENDAERSCCSSTAVAQARSLAHTMGMPHFTIDLRDEFRTGVVEPFIAGYAAGETPNPCVGCNGHVRLDAMLALADRLGCAALATGHYARTAERDDERGPLLRAAVDLAKDQTYMLAALSPRSLARMRFPLGDLRKPQVRQIAAGAGLPVAAKADSQDLCFLAGTSRARFLERHGGIDDRAGEIVGSDGTVVGSHLGQHRFTVGQRRGIGIQSAEPLYVLHKDGESGRVTVGSRGELRAERVEIRAARLHRAGARVDSVKLRYRQRPLRARLVGDADAGRHRSLAIELQDPADGAAPGQLACLMDGELVVGWGTIDGAQHRGDSTRVGDPARA
jgi:tRNA-uridine 2-sulfurtransferase